MSEQGNEATSDASAAEDAPEGAAGATEDVGTDGLAPAEDADGQPDAPDAGHVSSATDLPEGAEVDPLTDAAPQPVVDADEHDG